MLQPASGTMLQPASGTMLQPASGTMLQPAGGTMLQPAGGTMLQPAGGIMPFPAGGGYRVSLRVFNNTFEGHPAADNKLFIICFRRHPAGIFHNVDEPSFVPLTFMLYIWL